MANDQDLTSDVQDQIFGGCFGVVVIGLVGFGTIVYSAARFVG